ncbi:hypothetical protein L218DRAFT_1005530 [Marasmius fiardii PR-910]|nr:hypothetical protein L218DRAFT_1005530 [Marasmius fiardii PR-910]
MAAASAELKLSHHDAYKDTVGQDLRGQELSAPRKILLHPLEEETKELQWYEDQSTLPYRRLEEMEADKRDLEAHFEQRRYVASAQCRVPTEIWEEIFALVCSLSESHCSLMIKYDTEHYEVAAVPLILGQVCSRWRSIVACSPKLWASLYVELCREYPRCATKLVETFLTKSASYPLHLQVFLGSYRPESVQTTWTLLASHNSRFQQLYVVLSRASERRLRGMLKITFDNLAFISLDTSNIPFENSNVELALDSSFWKALSQAPKLTKVEMYRLYPPGSLPYRQLTTMRIHFLGAADIENFLSIMKVTAKLSSLTIGSFEQPEALLHLVPHRVEMLSLRTLSLCPGGDEDCYFSVAIENPLLEILLASLILPSLNTFQLSCFPHSKKTQVWPPFLLDMLKRSSTTLRYLSLSFAPHYDDNYLSWERVSVLLKTIPHITRLHLGINYGSSVYCNELIAISLTELADMSGGKGTAILPHLTHVSVTGITLATGDVMNTVLALATARSPTRLAESTNDDLKDVCPLNELRVENCSPSETVLEPETLEAIRGLERHGVRVVIARPSWW